MPDQLFVVARNNGPFAASQGGDARRVAPHEGADGVEDVVLLHRPTLDPR